MLVVNGVGKCKFEHNARVIFPIISLQLDDNFHIATLCSYINLHAQKKRQSYIHTTVCLTVQNNCPIISIVEHKSRCRYWRKSHFAIVGGEMFFFSFFCMTNFFNIQQFIWEKKQSTWMKKMYLHWQWYSIGATLLGVNSDPITTCFIICVVFIFDL